MTKFYTDTRIATGIWLFTCLTLSAGITGYAFLEEPVSVVIAFPLSVVASVLISLPALVILLFTIYRIHDLDVNANHKLTLLIVLNLVICLLY